jgi:hypothetical protein
MHSDPIDSAIDELAADVEKAVALLQVEDSQFHRRVYVRSLFAYLEGFTYWMRQNAIEIDKIVLRKWGALNWERHLLLHEEIPTVADNGEVKKQRQKTSFKSRFAFSVRAYAEIVQCNDDLFKSVGWQQLLNALNVRDRLMHPKHGESVIVSNEDIKACREGYNWFVDLQTKFKSAAKVMMGS